jgi:hypothetical protein
MNRKRTVCAMRFAAQPKSDPPICTNDREHRIYSPLRRFPFARAGSENVQGVLACAYEKCGTTPQSFGGQ